MNKQKTLYQGKAKTLYSTEDPNRLICEFRNDTSAFNGIKKEALTNKGKVNNYFNEFIMNTLKADSIPTHFIERISDTASLVKPLKMIPLECVIRNRAAGSICKRFNVEKGIEFNPPVFEFFLKDDDLGDPLVTESHIDTFKWATSEQLAEMKRLTLKINSLLSQLFHASGMLLVDFKLEFGLDSLNQVVLGDEFSPDGCRIWDLKTHEILDKDRFRQDLGQVVESYQLAAQRLGIDIHL